MSIHSLACCDKYRYAVIYLHITLHVVRNKYVCIFSSMLCEISLYSMDFSQRAREYEDFAQHVMEYTDFGQHAR